MPVAPPDATLRAIPQNNSPMATEHQPVLVGPGITVGGILEDSQLPWRDHVVQQMLPKLEDLGGISSFDGFVNSTLDSF